MICRTIPATALLMPNLPMRSSLKITPTMTEVVLRSFVDLKRDFSPRRMLKYKDGMASFMNYKMSIIQHSGQSHCGLRLNTHIN